MRAAVVLASLMLTGCGSYWDLRKGEELNTGCAGLVNWYFDADGDQWGEPGSTPTPDCAADDANGLTASNDRDCDDSDPGVTGQAGAICPDQMGAPFGGSPCVQGLQQGNSEFVGTCDGSPLVAFGLARTDCESWAGWATTADAAPGQRGLASLETEFEYIDVTTWLEGVAGGADLAVWVDLVWDGDLTTGHWEWPDGGEGTLPTWIPPCNGVEPHPVDLWPDLVLEVATETLEASRDDVRLALVYDGTSWCRGIPDARGGPFGPREALVLCERPRPDLSKYEDVPDDESDPPGAGE